eukprot:8001004-Lingulodinium_polyedra.AAC.1
MVRDVLEDLSCVLVLWKAKAGAAQVRIFLAGAIGTRKFQLVCLASRGFHGGFVLKRGTRGARRRGLLVKVDIVRSIPA